jgi:hypothetical protein
VRVILRLLVVASSVLAIHDPSVAHAASPASARQGRDPAADLRHVERMLYSVPLGEFVRMASAGDPWFDVTTDWCSAPLVGSTGRSFDFRSACRRHDFGYRNLKLLDTRYSCAGRAAGHTCASPGRAGTYWTAAARRRVDQQFLADMSSHCRARPWWESASCLGWAETFYSAVRSFGGRG